MKSLMFRSYLNVMCLRDKLYGFYIYRCQSVASYMSCVVL